MIIDMIAGFLLAALSGMGVGSAGLLVVWLTAFGNIPQLTAQGLNLYFFIISSSASMFIHLNRRKILFGAVILMTCFGIAGALVGSFIALRTDPSLLRRLFGLMLLFSGGASLIKILGEAKHSKKPNI